MLVREWREWRGMSREELAVKVGTTYSTIANLETGRHEPRIGLAQKIADALGVKLTDLRWEPDSDSVQNAKAAYQITLLTDNRPAQEPAKAYLLDLLRQAHLPEEEIEQTLMYLQDMAAKSSRRG